MSELAVDGALALADEPTPELDPTCFVFGGVAFEICPAPGVTWSIGAEHRLFAGSYSTSPVAGQVHCVVSPAPELNESFTREIKWEWSGDVARVETGRVRAELRRLAPGKYAATALVVPNDAGCSALVTALTAAVVNREGGFVLHAAGVEIDGRAVLFIGPSGAGKTTAANHCQGARWFARDRAVVYPTPLGWYAAGMAGGDDVDLPRASASQKPVGAILRVRRGAQRLAIHRAGSPTSICSLRESMMNTVLDRDLESEVLEALMAVASECFVGSLTSTLGVNLLGDLRALVQRGAR